MKPKRIQRKRTKGWKMPENTVYVGRGSKWGNPYTIAKYGRNCSIALFETYLLAGQLDVTVEDVKRELKGKNLACWCPLDKPCHADVLLEIANK